MQETRIFLDVSKGNLHVERNRSTRTYLSIYIYIYIFFMHRHVNQDKTTESHLEQDIPGQPMPPGTCRADITPV